MQLNDFYYNLPHELIARYPLAERSLSRLLCLDGQKSFDHCKFRDILQLLRAGDLLVFNDTKVIPARLLGKKTTGGRVEVLVERILDDKRILAQIYASKAPKIGSELLFAHDICLLVVNRQQQFYELRYDSDDKTILELIEGIGQIPLPPYMQRQAELHDHERYQTVYARHKGSVAAPTAGLHFDDDLLKCVRAKNVEIGYLTLHIGAGTFLPVRVENIREHKMHSEYLVLSEGLCTQIQEAKKRGGRVIAVGTTSLRALETAAQNGSIQPYRGETNIFIYPGYTFHSADVLITNLHLPCSTLLMLVCAFGGYNLVMRAYQEAVQNNYRFYSYGDAMWVRKGSSIDLGLESKTQGNT